MKFLKKLKGKKKANSRFNRNMTDSTKSETGAIPLEETHKEKLIISLKKEVKHIMEESVMLKCVHEDSASVASLCASVDACLSYGLKRRALGLFKTSSTTALIQKIAKDCSEANDVLNRVQLLEQNAGSKRTRSASSAGDSASLSRHGLTLEITQSGSNLTTGFTPRYMWIRIALFEKLLQKIVAYLVEECDKADLPANELVQRHKIASCGSSSSISNLQNSVSPNRKNGDCNFESSNNGRMNSLTSNTSSINLSLNQISPYRKSLSHTPSINSTLGFDEKRLVPSQAREYVESLHQNHKDILIYGKNNVHVQPQGRDTYLPGYLSLHQITKENEQLPRLALKWTPNQLMNAGGKIQNEEKCAAPSWQEALYIDLNSILFLHCHQDENGPGQLILVSSDGTQHPPLQFPSGGHMLMFLQCMESSVHNGGGKIDPPLATLTETEIQIKGADFQPTSADVSKAKRKFPWSKKEIKVTQSEEIPTTSPQEEIKFIGKVDWVFKLSMPSASIILDRRNSKENPTKRLPMLQLPKPKLSGSRDWLTNLFSPNKSRSNSSISLENKSLSSETVERDEENLEVQITCATSTDDTDSADENIGEASSNVQQLGKSPSEPISTLCSSMKRQIICRAFYGWLAYCRHLKTIRKHLGGLTFNDNLAIPQDLSWHNGITSDYWNSIDWKSLRYSDEKRNTFEQEIYLKIYLGGIEPSIRKEVWPYLLSHYKWIHSTEDKEKIDKRTKLQYENKLSDWMAIEAIVRQKDKETTAANIAKLAEKEFSGSVSTINMSNEVFESMDEPVSSRTMSVDKISTITEATENSTVSPSEKSPTRNKINSTNSEPTPPLTCTPQDTQPEFTTTTNGGVKMPPHSKKMAFFRENTHSADDEGMIDDHETENLTCNSCNTHPNSPKSKSNQNSKEDSSDTEGEDIISEAVTENVENNKKHEILSNGHTNGEENKSAKSVSYKATSPSVDSGNPSECSPLKAEPEIEDEELIDEVEHTENFENDICNITQKINILSSKAVETPVSSIKDTTSSSSRTHSPLSSDGGSYPQELIDNFALNVHRIDKDVQRCDRNHPYFTLANLEKLRNIITTYVWENLDVGYMQGMCDIVAPILVVFNEESITHSCFSYLMERMLCNFPNGNQMDENFANMRSLIQILDQSLYDTIQKNGDFSHFYFCYRWFLLDFKREFAYCDIFLVWETIWASRQVTSSHFYLFVALALVENYRDIILDRKMDFTDIIKFFNEMAEKHDGRTILSLARELVHQLQTIIVDQ